MERPVAVNVFTSTTAVDNSAPTSMASVSMAAISAAVTDGVRQGLLAAEIGT